MRSKGGSLTSPCSRRAAARPGTRRERPGPRPAAEGQLVRQFSVAPALAATAALLACLLFSCTSAGSTSDLAAVSSAASLSPQAIASIALFTYGNGDTATQWAQQRVTITSTRTVAERANGFVPALRTEGRTSAREWSRLCELVAQSGYFSTPGEQVLVSGFHAGDAEVTVSFADGTTSTVAHRAFYTDGASTFWTLVRVIEGSSLNALPLSEPPEPSR
jgi:hypothetical protein